MGLGISVLGCRNFLLTLDKISLAEKIFSSASGIFPTNTTFGTFSAVSGTYSFVLEFFPTPTQSSLKGKNFFLGLRLFITFFGNFFTAWDLYSELRKFPGIGKISSHDKIISSPLWIFDQILEFIFLVLIDCKSYFLALYTFP